LINAGITRKEDPRKLMELARELQAYPEATWNDRFVYLDFLHGLQDPQFSAYLTELEKTAPNKTSSLAALLSWMAKNNLSLLALDYSKSLPAESLRDWPVPLAIADTYVWLREWQNLEAATAKANWGRFEFLRHAYLARALRELDKPAAAEREWRTAVKDATSSESLVLLIQPVSEWGWENETTDLLWALAKHPEKQKDAFVALYHHYAKATDTQGLYRVLVRLSELDSTNLNVQNNLAQVSLLLNANLEEARRAAADVYHRSPTNPAYITTYAYSLLTQGNVKEALQIMSSLSEEQLRDPTISTYYGVFLAANGNEKARAYLDFGKQASLLPEEKALIDKARASLNSRSRNR
jgi:tetratricopeptide (TPR) repeat protein